MCNLFPIVAGGLSIYFLVFELNEFEYDKELYKALFLIFLLLLSLLLKYMENVNDY
jgi:hypothetical protein